jgi:hypothetical protein
MLRRIPLTLAAGLMLIATCEALLYLDVQHRGGIVVPADVPLPRPTTTLQIVARWVAVNMTALCWVGYLLTFDGLLRTVAGVSLLRARPNRFIVAWLTSIPVWCLFDWINFYFMDAWRYHGLPPHFSQRLVGYFIAFAAISPGMFLAAQLYQHLGFRRLRTRNASRNRLAAWTLILGVPAMLIGISVALALHARDATVLNLVLWISLIYLLDPINRLMGAPSLLADWFAGRWGRTLALFAGGATCGFCWEFWNYWALAKWTYHLPFLGSLGEYRYFEMPWLGFLGFLPFAAECWVMLNTIIAVLARCGLRAAEPLPDDDAVI